MSHEPILVAEDSDQDKVCPYCRDVIEPGQAAVTCRKCGTAHHKKCWKENGGCTVLNCGSRAYRKLVISLPAIEILEVAEPAPEPLPEDAILILETPAAAGLADRTQPVVEEPIEPHADPKEEPENADELAQPIEDADAGSGQRENAPRPTAETVGGPEPGMPVPPGPSEVQEGPETGLGTPGSEETSQASETLSMIPADPQAAKGLESPPAGPDDATVDGDQLQDEIVITTLETDLFAVSPGVASDLSLDVSGQETITVEPWELELSAAVRASGMDRFLKTVKLKQVLERHVSARYYFVILAAVLLVLGLLALLCVAGVAVLLLNT